MTHDTFATSSPRQPARAAASADQGRPSLFAEFDQRPTDGNPSPGIPLLSALESQRGTRPRSAKRRRQSDRTRPWVTRALMGVMGLGMLVMLLSFAQLLRRPPAAAPSASPAAAALAAAPQNAQTRPQPGPLTAQTAQTAQATEASTEAAEIIDVSPPQRSPLAGLTPAPAASAETAAAQSGATQVAALTPDKAAAQSTKTTKAGKDAKADKSDKPAKADKSAKAGQRIAHQDAAQQHATQDDVALVEALLAHATPRQGADKASASASLTPTAAGSRAARAARQP